MRDHERDHFADLVLVADKLRGLVSESYDEVAQRGLRYFLSLHMQPPFPAFDISGESKARAIAEMDAFSRSRVQESGNLSSQLITDRKKWVTQMGDEWLMLLTLDGEERLEHWAVARGGCGG
jgi:hypothetical protein